MWNEKRGIPKKEDKKSYFLHSIVDFLILKIKQEIFFIEQESFK
jgi:hypothetical protein